MGLETRDLYSSTNGDKWLLARELGSGRVFVRHIPNLPSGGKTTDIEIGAFLCERNYGPQHIELLRLIGTLVEKPCNPGVHESESDCFSSANLSGPRTELTDVRERWNAGQLREVSCGTDRTARSEVYYHTTGRAGVAYP